MKCIILFLCWRFYINGGNALNTHGRERKTSHDMFSISPQSSNSSSALVLHFSERGSVRKTVSDQAFSLHDEPSEPDAHK